MITDNVQLFLHHFVKHTRATKHNTVWLLCDNHESHISVEGLDYASENGVFITSHCNTEMVRCSYPNSVTPANIHSDFRVTRIHPFNGSIFTDDEFFSPRTDIKNRGQ